MKFIDVTVDHPEIIAKMKMAQNTNDESEIKVYMIRGTDTMFILQTHSKGQHASVSNRERPVRKAEIKKFISSKMNTNLEKTDIYQSSTGVIHILAEFKDKSPSY
ncbi:hypothetical protein CHCC15292_0755 [Bacillus licheniformis]|uniref:DUF1827 family protein n=1 Tax=Bacillus licheniformis TaxID=1402 RepID=UPI0011A5B7EF|nr:DUF1827 family protein [Bacillus licheniformis]TWL88033.1 hypothetical protein CHCC15292_0755 [Bacillus licheniformis]